MPIRVLLLWFALGSAMVLSGCSDPPADPGASRSGAEADQLRDRIRSTQTER